MSLRDLLTCPTCEGSRRLLKVDPAKAKAECPDCVGGVPKTLVDPIADELDNGIQAGPFAWRQNEAARLLVALRDRETG